MFHLCGSWETPEIIWFVFRIINIFLNLPAPPCIPASKNIFAFLFTLDFFSDNMEINQGIGKSHGPLPSWLCDTLSETHQQGNYLVAGRHWLCGLPAKWRGWCGVPSDNSSIDLFYHFVVVTMSPISKSGLWVICGIHSITEFSNTKSLWIQSMITGSW